MKMLCFLFILICLSSPVGSLSGALAACTLSLSSLNWTACRLVEPENCIYNAHVPGTALINLILNNSFEGVTDPFQDNILHTVPDINLTGPDFYTFTYTTNLTLSFAQLSKCKLGIKTPHTLLLLNGLNYRGTVFVDNIQIETESVGMYQRFSFDLSQIYLKETTSLRILIQPPDHPGDTCPTMLRPARMSSSEPCGQGVQSINLHIYIHTCVYAIFFIFSILLII